MIVTVRTLRLMPDYGCHPLWQAGPAGTFNLAPDDPQLGLTAELAGVLSDWATEYDKTLNDDDPLSSGFGTIEAEADFVRRGEALAQRLKEELGTEWRVTYFDTLLGADREIS